MDASLKDAAKFDEVIGFLLPLYTKYFTVSEPQELNKFYSTDPMQKLVAKQPLLQQEAMPIVATVMIDKQKQIEERLRDLFKDK